MFVIFFSHRFIIIVILPWRKSFHNNLIAQHRCCRRMANLFNSFCPTLCIFDGLDSIHLHSSRCYFCRVAKERKKKGKQIDRQKFASFFLLFVCVFSSWVASCAQWLIVSNSSQLLIALRHFRPKEKKCIRIRHSSWSFSHESLSFFSFFRSFASTPLSLYLCISLSADIISAFLELSDIESTGRCALQKVVTCNWHIVISGLCIDSVNDNSQTMSFCLTLDSFRWKFTTKTLRSAAPSNNYQF